MTRDPCFTCTLPDCDDTSPRCGLRRLYRSYCRKVRAQQKQLITDDEREANNRIFEMWKLERLALAAEGVRPYRRRGSAWVE